MSVEITATLTEAWSALLNTILFFFGGSFVFGFMLYALSRLTRNLYAVSGFLRADVYVTGWLGTPIHELGHALFCVIFRHKITALKLFQPRSAEGSLGYVQHSYNSRNVYHQIGNFFIGSGPVFSAALVLWLLLMYVLPYRESVTPFLQFNYDFTRFPGPELFAGVFANFAGLVKTLFTVPHFTDYRFWLFLYPAMCVASHAGLSPSDLRQMMTGLFFLMITLFILFAVLLFFKVPFLSLLYSAAGFVSTLNKLLLFAVFTGGITFIVTYCVLAVLYLITNRKILPLF